MPTLAAFNRVKRVALCLSLSLLATTTAASIDKRMALVIGNASYEYAGPLQNALNDARDVAANLRGVGFDVTLIEDASLDDLIDAVDTFVADLHEQGGTGLLYYAGHGVQVNGRNFLVPVDARLTRQSRVKYEAYALDDALTRMGGRGAGSVNLVILDACRNNPFAFTRSAGSQGLARVTAPESTLILYAAKPGQTASDNPDGRNGLFTEHLLKAISRPGVDVEQAFTDVVVGVYHDSGRAQYPWKEGVLLLRFSFVDESAQPSDAADDEAEVWRRMDRCGTVACYRAYQQTFPNGRYAAVAEALIRDLRAPPEEEPLLVASAPPSRPSQDGDLQLMTRIQLNRFGKVRFAAGKTDQTRDWRCELIARDEDQGHLEAGTVLTIGDVKHYYDWRSTNHIYHSVFKSSDPVAKFDCTTLSNVNYGGAELSREQLYQVLGPSFKVLQNRGLQNRGR